MTAPLKSRLTDDMKAAMKSGEKQRLGTIRMALAEIKRREVDDRVDLDDAQITSLIEKMVKQRRDALTQYEAANRQDLADIESFEIGVLKAYLPEQLSEAELTAIVEGVINATGAESMKDMGKVMGQVKAKVAGRADMQQVSAQVKALLA
ncbi:MAG: GatB/YqeY domain-containing protein [Lysobacterales bacterium]